MPSNDDWSGEERRKILERRREARQEERDRQAEAAAAAGEPLPERRAKRGKKTERRIAQICFVCHEEFAPTSSGQTVCDRCTLDGVRGGGRNGWRAPRF
jgi:hypothetical protein